MHRWFNKASNKTATLAASPYNFALAVVLIAVWALSGVLFNFSDTWQLIANTFTTLVTFLMVFLIQNEQNRNDESVQVKLDELIHSIKDADNRFIGIEALTKEEIDEIKAEVEDEAGEAADEKPPRREPNNEESERVEQG